MLVNPIKSLIVENSEPAGLNSLSGGTKCFKKFSSKYKMDLITSIYFYLNSDRDGVEQFNSYR